MKEMFYFIRISPYNIYFGYVLESPHWGVSNKYQKYVSWSIKHNVLAQFRISCYLLNEG